MPKQRALQGMHFMQDDIHPTTCAMRCSFQGYKFFGLQYGGMHHANTHPIIARSRKQRIEDNEA